MPKFSIPEDTAIQMGLPRPCVAVPKYLLKFLRRIHNKKNVGTGKRPHVGMLMCKWCAMSSRLRFRIRTKEVPVPPDQVSSLLESGAYLWNNYGSQDAVQGTFKFVPVVEMQEEGDNGNQFVGNAEDFKIQDPVDGLEKPIAGKTELEVNQMMFNNLGNAYCDTKDPSTEITPPTDYELVDGVKVEEPGTVSWFKSLRHPDLFRSQMLGGFWSRLWKKVKSVVSKVGNVIKQVASGVAKAAIGILPGPLGKPLEKLRKKYLGDSKITDFVANVAKRGFSLVGLQQRTTTSGPGEGQLGAAQSTTLSGALYYETAKELMENYDELPVTMDRTWGGDPNDEEPPLAQAYSELVGETSEYDSQPGSGDPPDKPTESFDNKLDLPELKALCYDDSDSPFSTYTHTSGAHVTLSLSCRVKTAFAAGVEFSTSNVHSAQDIGKMCPANAIMPNPDVPMRYIYFTPCWTTDTTGTTWSAAASNVYIQFFPKATVPCIKISFPYAMPVGTKIMFNTTYCQDPQALAETTPKQALGSMNPFAARSEVMNRYRKWNEQNEMLPEGERKEVTPSFNNLPEHELPPALKFHYPENTVKEKEPKIKKNNGN